MHISLAYLQPWVYGEYGSSNTVFLPSAPSAVPFGPRGFSFVNFIEAGCTGKVEFPFSFCLLLFVAVQPRFFYEKSILLDATL